MSDKRMSFDDAKSFVKKLQEQNVKPSTIRRQMIDKGFSYAEISAMSGENEQAKTNYNTGPKSGYNAKSEFSYDAKPKSKNDSGQNKEYQYNSSYIRHEQFERGGCLTAYLSFQIIAIFLAFMTLCATLSDLSNAPTSQSGLISTVFLAVLFVSILQFACIIALWGGKRWGYQGLLGLLFLAAVLNIISGSFAEFGASLVSMGILVALVQSREHLLS